MAGIFRMRDIVALLFWIIYFNAVVPVYCGESCGPPGDQEFCEHGCCDSDGGHETCCSVSTSVLVVACVVSGLVLIAMITSIVICCYKNYKDKQASRVRRIQQEEAMNAPRVRGVEPRKPPEYISAPPAYSVEMPESHYRPQTVTGHISQVSYNQRFRGNVATTRTSGRHPVNTSESMRNPQIPGAVPLEAPPPYSQYARGQTPANRRQRFITTPLPEENNNNHVSHSHNTNVTLSSSSINAREPNTPRVRLQQNLQTQPIEETNSPLSSITDSSDSSSRVVSTRADDSRAVESRVQESRVESRPESRSQTVARVLGARAPSRAAPSRAAPRDAPSRVGTSRHAQTRVTQSRDTERTNQSNPFILIGGVNTSVTPSTNTGTSRQPPNGNSGIVEDLTIV